MTNFIPRDRQVSFRNRQPIANRVVGTALFADISGFSKLTRKLLNLLGEQGAEAVPACINPLYDAIVYELHRFGGSVIGFAGDAITCWLDGEADSGMRAVACAVAMQNAMATVSEVLLPDGSRFHLGLKVSIASGVARRFMVGDPDILVMDALAGKVVATMAQGEKYANAGDIVLSQATYEQVADQVVVREQHDGYVMLDRLVTGWTGEGVGDSAELPPLDPQIANAWVLAPTRERMTISGFLAELRYCTALFLRFDGINYDEDDTAGDKLNQFVAWVQHIIQRDGGHMIQLTLGDKGSYLYAVFGAPISYGKNSVRAATAALTLREAHQTFDFIANVQVGLSQGRMWTGAYGAEVRSTYGALSDATNMAARLMMRAGLGEAIIDDSTVAELSEQFSLTSYDTMIAKGRETPLPIWRLDAPKERTADLPTFTLPLFDREHLTTQLHRYWQRAAAGERQVATVAGEAGIGKSHLITTFVRSLANTAQIAVSTSNTTDNEIVYAGWRQLFLRLLSFSSSADLSDAEIRTALAGTGFEADVRLPLLGDLLGKRLPENAMTAALEPEVRRDTLTALVIEMLHDWTTRSPLLIVMDDVQWLDSLSITLLQKVVQQSAEWRLLILLVYRPLGDKLATVAATQSLDVETVSAETTQQIAHYILDAPISLLFSNLLFKLTNGNPFFVESLLTTMRLTGQIEQTDNRWDVSEQVRVTLRAANYIKRVDNQWQLVDNADLRNVRLGLPASIHDTVLARIDQLREPTKLALKVASVIGMQFRTLLVSLAYPHPVADKAVDAEIQMLGAEALISSSDQTLHQFRHRSTQEVAYSTLLFSQRRELHRRVARGLQQLETDSLDAIAQHAFEGELWELALRCYVSLGARARQLHANHQSISTYRRVLGCLEHVDEATVQAHEMDARLALGEALVNVGQHDEARSELLQSLKLSQDDPYKQARVYRWLARSQELQGDFDAALEWLEKGLAVGGASVESAEMLAIAGLIEARRGNFDKAQTLCEQTLRMTDHVDAPAFRGRALNLLAIISRLRSKPKDAIRFATESLETYRAISNRRGEALALNEIAVANVEHGSWRVAVEAYHAARNIFFETGDIYHRILTENNLGNIARDQGREDDALEFYSAALNSLEQIGGSPYIKGALQINVGAAYLHKGSFAAAAAGFEAAHVLFEQAGSRDFASELDRYRAQLALAQGDINMATAYAEQALAVAQEMSMRAAEGYALYVRGMVGVAVGAWVSAETDLTESVAIFDEVEDPYGSGQARLKLAQLLNTSDLQRAKILAAEAAQLFEQIDAQVAQAEAQRIAARTV